MIAYIMFGKTILVIAPHHGVSQMKSSISVCYLPSIVWLSAGRRSPSACPVGRGSDGVKQSVAELIERCATGERSGCRIFHLGEEQLMPAAVLARSGP